MNKQERTRNRKRMAQHNPREIPPPTKQFYNGCRGKLAFHSERMADKVAELRMADEPGLRLRHYKCTVCSQLHLTSQGPFPQNDH